jgi:hypothetical protein
VEITRGGAPHDGAIKTQMKEGKEVRKNGKLEPNEPEPHSLL